MNGCVKFILTLGLSFFLGINLYLAADYYTRFEAKVARMQKMEKNIGAMRGKLQRARSTLDKARTIQNKLSRLDKTALSPKKWYNFPMQIQKKANMGEIPSIVDTISRGRPRPSNYWFKPDTFLISSAGTGKKKGQRIFNLMAKGSFLIPPE